MTSSHHDRRTPELHQMQRAIAGLLIYQDILDSEVGIALIDLLQAIASGDRSQGNALICLTAYGRFFKALAVENCSWEEYLIDRVLQAENPFSLQVQRVDAGLSIEPSQNRLSSALVTAAGQDLQSLHILYTCGQYIPQWMEQIGGNPICWLECRIGEKRSTIIDALHSTNWGELVDVLARYYQQSGVGIFGKYRAFRWQQQLVGIANPDRVGIDDLVGYEQQKATLINNTKSLLAGKPALNILLYGGKGTGKSSLIKGLLNDDLNSQLRLVEVSKSAMIDLPLILDRLTDLPQKFIIFVHFYSRDPE